MPAVPSQRRQQVSPDGGVTPLWTRGGREVAYDVSADGERFVFVKRPLERAPRRLIVVTNWFEELRELVAN